MAPNVPIVSIARHRAAAVALAFRRTIDSYRKFVGRLDKLTVGVPSMDRRSVVMAIVGSADGLTFSPVQLQKAVFLVSQNALHIFDASSHFSFSPYDYGPYDKAVYEEASALADAGLVSIEKPSQSRYRQYAASAEGIERAKEIISRLDPGDADYLRRVAAWVRSLGFAALVKSIYEAYPDMKQNSVFAG